MKNEIVEIRKTGELVMLLDNITENKGGENTPQTDDKELLHLLKIADTPGSCIISVKYYMDKSSETPEPNFWSFLNMFNI